MTLLKCEICGCELDFLDGFFSCPDMEKGAWQFACIDCPDGFYDFYVKRFFNSPGSTIDCLAHLQEKRWFKPDKFFEFMHRLRANGKCYFQS